MPTFPLIFVDKDEAKASQPTILAISCTKRLVDLASHFLDRNCESFARTQGCLEMCTLTGLADVAAMLPFHQ